MLKITDSQKKIRDFYTKYYDKYGYYPTYKTAGDMLGMTPAGVFKNIKGLEAQNLLSRTNLGQITRKSDSQKIEIVGTISCGYGINISDIDQEGEYIEVPTSILQKDMPGYILRAQGDSMKEAGIFDGDLLVIRYQNYANDGDIIVAIIKDGFNEKATLKQYYRTSKSIFLKPRNSAYETIIINEEQPAEIRGKLVGILRKF